jgi:uncharacterized membrane protein HdeD (DUF308 family)
MGWGMIFRGVFAVFFGLITLRSPAIAVSALGILFAIYAFVDGVLDVVIAVQLGRVGQRWAWHLFAGIASVAVGVIALAFPGVTLLAITLLVGLYAIAHGTLEIAGAFSMSEMDTGSRWMLGLTGVFAVILGLLLLGGPGAGALALVWTIAVFAIMYGAALLGFGLRVLSIARHEAHEADTHRPVAAH